MEYFTGNVLVYNNHRKYSTVQIGVVEDASTYVYAVLASYK